MRTALFVVALLARGQVVEAGSCSGQVPIEGECDDGPTTTPTPPPPPPPGAHHDGDGDDDDIVDYPEPSSSSWERDRPEEHYQPPEHPPRTRMITHHPHQSQHFVRTWDGEHPTLVSPSKLPSAGETSAPPPRPPAPALTTPYRRVMNALKLPNTNETLRKQGEKLANKQIVPLAKRNQKNLVKSFLDVSNAAGTLEGADEIARDVRGAAADLFGFGGLSEWEDEILRKPKKFAETFEDFWNDVVVKTWNDSVREIRGK